MFSARLKSGNSQRGFTLIEIMAVVLIIGLALGLGLRMDLQDLSVEARNEGKRFANAASVVLEEAVLSGELWGVDFYQSGDNFGYRWVHLDEGAWQVDSPEGLEEVLPHTEMDPAFHLQVEIEKIPFQPSRLNQTELASITPDGYLPPVVFTPDHQTVPFTFTIKTDRSSAVTVETDLLGRFRIRE